MFSCRSEVFINCKNFNYVDELLPLSAFRKNDVIGEKLSGNPPSNKNGVHKTGQLRTEKKLRRWKKVSSEKSSSNSGLCSKAMLSRYKNLF